MWSKRFVAGSAVFNGDIASSAKRYFRSYGGVKMSECSHDCSSCSANCGSRTQEKTDFLEPLYRESKVKKVIGIVSGKGGVGKSMTTSLLGVAAMRKRVAYSNS